MSKKRTRFGEDIFRKLKVVILVLLFYCWIFIVNHYWRIPYLDTFQILIRIICWLLPIDFTPLKIDIRFSFCGRVYS
jgi:hypothetical protein